MYLSLSLRIVSMESTNIATDDTSPELEMDFDQLHDFLHSSLFTSIYPNLNKYKIFTAHFSLPISEPLFMDFPKLNLHSLCRISHSRGAGRMRFSWALCTSSLLTCGRQRRQKHSETPTIAGEKKESTAPHGNMHFHFTWSTKHGKRWCFVYLEGLKSYAKREFLIMILTWEVQNIAGHQTKPTTRCTKHAQAPKQTLANTQERLHSSCSFCGACAALVRLFLSGARDFDLAKQENISWNQLNPYSRICN